MENSNNNKKRKEIEEENEEEGTDKQPRLSFFYNSSAIKPNIQRERALDEIDRVEQLITLNLQKINENLMISNNVISSKLIPTLEKFNSSSIKLFNNINHIKEFFENAANVNILTKKDVKFSDNENENDGNDSNYLQLRSSSFTELKHDRLTSSDNNLSRSSSLVRVNDDNSNNNNVNKEIIEPTISNMNNTRSLFDGFKVNIDEESTGKNPVQRNVNESIDDEEFFTINTFKSDDERRESNEKEKEKDNEKELDVEEEEEEEEGGIESEDKSNKFVKDLMSGYESPPWEEPPVLQSVRYSKHLHHKRRSEETGIRSDEREETNNNNNNDDDDKASEDNEDNEESDEDVSIRFPSSPKYGGGGKLLRSNEGRQIALDFARSEMMKEHPILSLQRDSTKSKIAPIRRMPTTSDPFRSDIDDSSSSFEDVPVLESEKLPKRYR